MVKKKTEIKPVYNNWRNIVTGRGYIHEEWIITCLWKLYEKLKYSMRHSGKDQRKCQIL